MSTMEAVNKIRWGHTIDLGGGVVTRGSLGPPSEQILGAFRQIDFAGKKVLDIGCWDGLWSFEAEKRGAKEVWATDCVSQRWGGCDGFNFAHHALQSRVNYVNDLSVYEIPERLEDRDFDVVIFCGVYYHLKDPLLAFARIRQVMRDGGVIVVEGDAIDDPEPWARFYYRDLHASDASNWWVPTIGCLREWIECSFFEVTSQDPVSTGDRRVGRIRRAVRVLKGKRLREVLRRYLLVARAVRRSDPGYLYPDAELRQADLNTYGNLRTPGGA